MESSQARPHVVLLSTPAHLIPILELAKRLVTYQNLKVTVFVASNHKTAAKEALIVQSAAASKLCDVVHLPPVNTFDHAGITQFLVAVREIKPALRYALAALESPPTAFILHHLAVDCFEIADEFKIPKFVYVSPHAWFLSLVVYLPVLDKTVEGDFVDLKEPIRIPGCKSIRPEDVPTPLVRRVSRDYAEYLRVGMEIPKAEGILVNTWEELQPEPLAALRDDKLLGCIAKAPIYPVGPVCPGAPARSKNELFDWLDEQPRESVVYVSFGSVGGLSQEQITELAWGLELSQERFVWVVRPPAQKSGIGHHPRVDNDDMSGYLPEGFKARTRDTGLVIPQWAPQLEILSHPSVGAFFSHCGWNSITEGITNGLPVIAWPLYAEQGLNATMLTEEFGIAVKPKVLPTKGLVGREEIRAMVRRIMADVEGGAIRDRAKALKLSGERAWSEGGSSYNALAQVTKRFTACGLEKSF